MDTNQVENQNSQKPAKVETVGPFIGSLIIIVLVILAGLYFWGYVLRQNNQKEESGGLDLQVEVTPPNQDSNQ